MNKIVDVTAYVSTKGRYDTTLPMTIASIAMQSVVPKRFILFEDSEPVDIRTNNVYLPLLHVLTNKGIDWSVEFGPKKGQSWNHQKAIDMCKTEWLWRVDDDHICEANVLEELLKCGQDNKDIGAIGGLVIDPTQLQTTSDLNLTNKISEIDSKPNCQWMKHTRTDVFEVEHLYSTFIYRKDASSHGYNLNLSPVCHREESMFSIEMGKKGWKLLVNPNVITWHSRAPEGGIRSYRDPMLWDHDEKIFQNFLQNINQKDVNFYSVLNGGIGDHFIFRNILPELKERYGDKLVLAVCYPAVFQNDGVKLISIQEAKDRLNGNIEKYDIYRWCGERKWSSSLIEAYRKMYLK